jgi:hypothetical protein
MALNFPDNPSVGDTYNDTISGFIYRWDGTVWESLYDTIAAVDSNISVDTTPQLGGNLDLNSNDITGTGNIDITGTLNVTGVSTFQDNVNVTGNLAVNPDGDGFTFPTTDGSANQVLQTDGEGNLSFATVSGGGGSEGPNSVMMGMIF